MNQAQRIENLEKAVEMLTKQNQKLEEELRASEMRKEPQEQHPLPQKTSSGTVRVFGGGEEVPTQQFFSDAHRTRFNVTCPVPMNARGDVTDKAWQYEADTDEWVHYSRFEVAGNGAVIIPKGTRAIQRVPGSVVREYQGRPAVLGAVG